MNKISRQLLIKSKHLFLLSNTMNIIGNLFRPPSKNSSNNAKLNKQVQFLSPQKCNSHTKSQTLSQGKNWTDISMDVSFYLQKLIEVKLGKTDIVPKTKEDKSHMVYEVWVMTSDFQYKIKKRFSVFNQFYCHIKKDIFHLNIVFPKKTLLVSGTNIQVVSQRYQLLNNFIKRVLSQAKQQKNTDFQVRFLSFLQIDEQYQKRKIKTFTELPKDPMDKYDNIFCVQDTSIAFQMRKLNDYNNHQREVLSRIESYVSYRSYKLTNDEIKILLVGNSESNLKGLLNLSLSINNEIKSLELLRFLLDYLSPSKKTHNDKIYKQFERLPLETFHFAYDSIKNNFSIIEFKKIFFVILQLYCQNKLFSETKILQLYPDLLAEFELWKNLSEFNQGNVRKASSGSNLHFKELLKKPSNTLPEKAKSFQIHPKQCETPDSLSPLIGAQNLKVSSTKSTASQDKKNKFSSFKSNDSTSQLIIEEDWELSKMKLQSNQIQENFTQMNILQSTQTYCLKTKNSNKLSIEILKTSKTLKECEQLSKSWNKLIYDERHDPFTGISRIYMKLNGKSKIFKYRQQDQKVEVKDENFIFISKRRLESHNSIAKSGKENIEETLITKVNSPSNGFEEIITIENINQSTQNEEERKECSFRKVTIEMNFEGEEEYFRSEIQGSTSALMQYAVKAFLN